LKPEAQNQVDLVFLDLRFGRDREIGLSILKWIKDSEDFDHIPVNIMSGESLNRAEIQKLLAAGAAGFISKTSTTKQLFGLALQNIEAGCVFIQAADIDFDQQNPISPERPKMTPESLGIRPSHYKVLVRHARGMPYKRIASQCKISEQTVRETVGELCKIFKAENSKSLIYQLAISGVALDEGI